MMNDKLDMPENAYEIAIEWAFGEWKYANFDLQSTDNQPLANLSFIILNV